jgi:hypothetical protein
MNLVVMGAHHAADGHGVVMNPTPAGRCSFAAGDVRAWDGLDDVVNGVCGVDAAYTLHHADNDDADTGLCVPHAAHVRACPSCSVGVGRLVTAGA